MKPALDIYRENFLREPIEVLGRRLLPFTLGHALTMDRLEIHEISTPDDLLMAVLLCSMSVEDFERKSESRLFGLWLVWWSWRCMRRWRDPEAFMRSLKLFAEYLDEQTICPDFDIIQSGDEINGGVPFVQHLRVVLCSKLNYRPETVMSTTFTQAHWDYVAYLENERAVQVLDGRRGENAKARFADADAKHEERIKEYEKLNGRCSH